MKLIVQLRKNAFAIELAVARVKIRDSRDEDAAFGEEDETDELDPGFRQDPSGSVYASTERARPDVDMSRTHHIDEVRAFGFSRSSARPEKDPA